jgi:hypothetical protein
MSWKVFEKSKPDLAAFGRERLHRRVCYLATIRKDGSPRVHPVTPLVVDGHLFVFMYPSSPKGHDLRRDGRYAMHSSVADNDGTGGEFGITGRAELVQNQTLRKVADDAARHQSTEQYILFEFEIEAASSTVYQNDKPIREHWIRCG